MQAETGMNGNAGLGTRQRSQSEDWRSVGTPRWNANLRIGSTPFFFNSSTDVTGHTGNAKTRRPAAPTANPNGDESIDSN